jgi:hypothetical protein
VREVRCAADWAALVAEHPRPGDGGVHLDWSAAAAEVDAVHVTAGAVAAAQGLRLRTPAGPTAPAFWDVESTRWLRWCFTAVRPHDVTVDCP